MSQAQPGYLWSRTCYFRKEITHTSDADGSPVLQPRSAYVGVFIITYPFNVCQGVCRELGKTNTRRAGSDMDDSDGPLCARQLLLYAIPSAAFSRPTKSVWELLKVCIDARQRLGKARHVGK